MDETNRRRKIQLEYNEKHGITPETIRKAIRSSLERTVSAYKIAAEVIHASESQLGRTELIALLEKDMLEAAQALEFERAARLRDRIRELRDSPELAVAAPAGPERTSRSASRRPRRTRA